MSRQTSINPKTIVSSYSLLPELSEPLKQVVADTGLKYLSELLTMLASRPEESAAALRPIADLFKAQRVSPVRTKSERTRKKELMEHFSAAELEALLTASKKAVGQ